MWSVPYTYHPQLKLKLLLPQLPQLVPRQHLVELRMLVLAHIGLDRLQGTVERVCG